MSQPLLPDVAPPEDQTFGDIVWLQFKKNRVAYCSLWGLAGLFALAITAPLLASGRPFIWDAGEGMMFPWFSGLFDRCLLYTSPSPRDRSLSRMPSSA